MTYTPVFRLTCYLRPRAEYFCLQFEVWGTVQ